MLYPVELQALTKNPTNHTRDNLTCDGRGRRIRTADPLLPKQMRYQTAPCPAESQTPIRRQPAMLIVGDERRQTPRRPMTLLEAIRTRRRGLRRGKRARQPDNAGSQRSRADDGRNAAEQHIGRNRTSPRVKKLCRLWQDSLSSRHSPFQLRIGQ